MFAFLFDLLLTALAVYITAWILPGVSVKGFRTAFWTALLLSFLNVVLLPILILLSIPFILLTLGLFMLVLNTLVVLVASMLIENFKVKNFWWALAFSLVLTLVNAVLNWL